MMFDFKIDEVKKECVSMNVKKIIRFFSCLVNTKYIVIHTSQCGAHVHHIKLLRILVCMRECFLFRGRPRIQYN